jgi:hypothetical protein
MKRFMITLLWMPVILSNLLGGFILWAWKGDSGMFKHDPGYLLSQIGFAGYTWGFGGVMLGSWLNHGHHPGPISITLIVLSALVAFAGLSLMLWSLRSIDEQDRINRTQCPCDDV